MLVTVWGALSIIFLLFVIIPGDSVTSKSRERSASASIEANIRHEYGLDRSSLAQYGNFWSGLLRADLGVSVQSGKSVNRMLGETATTSARLAFWGGLVQVVGSLVLGVMSAYRRRSLFDRTATAITIAVYAMPVFVTGLVLQVVFGVLPNRSSSSLIRAFNLNVFQPTRWALGVLPVDNWKGWVLPSLTVGIVNMALLARLLRSSLLDVFRADYLRTATSKGLSPIRIVVKHALPNAIVAWLAASSFALVEIFGIAVETEFIFGINGIGSQIAQSAKLQDVAPVLGLTSVVVLAAAFASLSVDIVHGLLDPRIRADDRDRR